MTSTRRDSSRFSAPGRFNRGGRPVRCAIAILLVSSSLLFVSCSLGRSAPADELRRQLQANENDVAVRAKLVEQLAADGNYPEAASVGREGLVQHPNDVALLKALSMAHTYWASYGKSVENRRPAEKYVKKLIELGAAGSTVYERLGWLQDANGAKDEALESYETAANLAPDNARLLGKLGYAHTQAGRYEKAIPLLQRAALAAQSADSTQSPARVWRWLGDAQRMAGDYASAMTSMEKAHDLAPKTEKKEYKDYTDFTRSLISDTPSWTAYRAHLGIAERHRDNHRPDRAVAEYEKAGAVIPPEPAPDALWQHGWIELQLAYQYGNVGQAEKVLEHAPKAAEVFEEVNYPFQLGFAYEYLAHANFDLAIRPDLDLQATGKETKKTYEESAIRYCEQAEQAYQRAGAPAELLSGRSFRAGLMLACHGVDDPRAKELYEELLKKVPSTGDVTDRYDVKLAGLAAQYCDRTNDRAGSFAILKRLLRYFDSLPPKEYWDGVALFYNNIAQHYLSEQKDLDACLKYHEKALAVTNAIRDRVGSDKFKRSSVGLDFERACLWLVQHNTERGDYEKAFKYAEEYKGRALLDLLSLEAVTKKKASFRNARQNRASFWPSWRIWPRRLPRPGPMAPRTRCADSNAISPSNKPAISG